MLVGMTQGQLAEAAGLAKSSVGRYEAGLAGLHSDSFGAILAVLSECGVRFVEKTDEVEVGVLLLRKSMPKVTDGEE